MPVPIVEKITRDIADTIAGVRMAAGYNNDLVVERFDRTGNPPRKNLIVIYQRSPTLAESQTDNHRTWDQPYTAVCYVLKDEDRVTPIDHDINLVRSDVEKALLVDHTRGGLAFDTIIENPDLFDSDDGAFTGINFNFTVRYRTLFTDPYSQ
jgi:hypothetical protein